MGVDLPVKDTVPVPPLVLIGILYYSSNYIPVSYTHLTLPTICSV